MRKRRLRWLSARSTLRRLIPASSVRVLKSFLHFPKQEYKKHWDRRLRNYEKQWQSSKY